MKNKKCKKCTVKYLKKIEIEFHHLSLSDINDSKKVLKASYFYNNNYSFTFKSSNDFKYRHLSVDDKIYFPLDLTGSKLSYKVIGPYYSLKRMQFGTFDDNVFYIYNINKDEFVEKITGLYKKTEKGEFPIFYNLYDLEKVVIELFKYCENFINS
jgi:hypothetical protein